MTMNTYLFVKDHDREKWTGSSRKKWGRIKSLRS